MKNPLGWPVRHYHWQSWYKYWWPRRLTLRLADRPAIYRWLLWIWEWSADDHDSENLK